jgi:hypothetical protein
MALSSAFQASAYLARRRRRAQLLLGQLVPWSAGLTVSSVGLYVSSEGGTSCWVSTSTGVTGASAPVSTSSPSGLSINSHNDGGVSWTRVDVKLLLHLQTIPTP